MAINIFTGFSSDLLEFLNDASESQKKYLCYQSDLIYNSVGDLVAFVERDQAEKYCYWQSAPGEVIVYSETNALKKLVEEFCYEQALSWERDSRAVIKIDVVELDNWLIINEELKTKSMNENNLEYLENQLLMTGFGDIPRAKLIEKIETGNSFFQLELNKTYGQDEAKAYLNFKRSDQGNYFFNSYDLVVKNEGSEEAMKQRFDVYYGNFYTMKEAFNLMQGRSVFKEFIKVDREDRENNQKYTAWSTLDFKNTNAEGNFKIVRSYNLDTAKALAEYPFKELANERYKQDLVASLNRGNRQSATYVLDGKEQKMYVEANPRHKSLRLFDETGNPIKLSMKVQTVAQSNGVQQEQATGAEQETPTSERNNQTQMQNQQAEEGPNENQSRGRGRGRSVA